MQLLSAFGGGLWIIPLLLLIGSYLFYRQLKKEGSPAYLLAAIVCAAAAVGSVIWMISAA